MSRRLRLWGMLFVLVTASSGWSGALAPGAFDRLPDLHARLASLSPDHPDAYLLLAEEVAGESFTEEDTRLARRLAVHAVGSARERPAADDVVRSALLLLIDLEPPGARRDALLSITAQLDAQAPVRALAMPPPQDDDADLRVQAAIAVGAVRAGEGHQARQRLDDPRIARLLDGYAGAYPPAGGRRLAAHLREMTEGWPCPECGNEGARPVPGRRRELERCPNCEGDPGPASSLEARVALLRLEVALLSGDATAWSRRLAASPAPARMVVPDDLASLFAIDPGASVYRDGGWVRP